MRRVILRNRRPLGSVIAILLALVAGFSFAGPSAVPGEDRPPLLAVEAAPAGSPAASRLVDVNVAPGTPGSTELVLRGNGGLPYEVFALADPDRLVLDLPGVRADLARRRLDVGQSGLVRVRIGQYREAPVPMARVVVELKGQLPWKITRDGDVLRLRLGAGEGAAASLPHGGAKAAAPAQGVALPAVASTTPAPASSAAAPVPAVSQAPAPQPVQAAKAVSPQPVAVASAAPAKVTEAAEVKKAPGPAAARPVPAPASERTPFEKKETASAIDQRPLPPPPALNNITPAVAQPAKSTKPAELPKPEPAAQVTSKRETPLVVAETKTIQDQRRQYTGRPISLQLVDADIRQVFSLFHDLSGLNFVLDPSVAGSVTIVVDEVPWDQALDLILQNNSLEMVVEGNVIRISRIEKLAQEAAARRTLKEAKDLEVTPVTITRTLSYAKASEVERVVRDVLLSTKGKVVVDERTNSLVLRDIPDRVEAVDKLLATLDAETPQVMIEARIVAVARKYTKNLGVKWGVVASADPKLGTQTNLQFPHRAKVDYSLNLPTENQANTLKFSFGNVLDSFTLDLALNALEEDGLSKTLSAPRVAAQNNALAEIEQGVRLPITKTTATEIMTEFVNAMLKMSVRPQITADGTVIMEVTVENSVPDFTVNIGALPPINTQKATTKLQVPDGGTTVIGGIFTVNEGDTQTGVPWFRKLPGIGWLFRNRTITNQNNELLIFLTPRIIKAS